MKNYSKKLFISLILMYFINTSMGFADLSVTGLKTMKKPILSEEMMKGYSLIHSELYKEEDGDKSVNYQENWKRKSVEGYDNRYPGQISINIMIYKNREDAIERMNRKRKMKSWATSYFKKGFGEEYYVLLSKHEDKVFVNPIYLIYRKGNVIVNMSGRGPYGDPPVDSIDFFVGIASYVESKI